MQVCLRRLYERCLNTTDLKDEDQERKKQLLSHTSGSSVHVHGASEQDRDFLRPTWSTLRTTHALINLL